MNNLFSKAEGMETQSENKTTVVLLQCCSEGVRGMSTLTPHTDTSFPPQRIIAHRGLGEGWETAAFVQKYN